MVFVVAFGLGSVPTKSGDSDVRETKYQLGEASARKYARARARSRDGARRARRRGCLPATTQPTVACSMATLSARTEAAERQRRTTSAGFMVPVIPGGHAAAGARNADATRDGGSPRVTSLTGFRPEED